MHENRCIFISLHDSLAISRLVFVFTCQVLWVVLQNSRPVHKFLCVAEIGLWGGSSAPNELFPSSFSLSCHLVSTHIWHLCNQLSELLSCWAGRPRRQMNGCYSDVRRAFKRLSLCSAFVDDWLWSLMAWHNHLPSYLTSSPEFSFHPPLLSVYLCLDLVSTCVCIYATELNRVLWWWKLMMTDSKFLSFTPAGTFTN